MVTMALNVQTAVLIPVNPMEQGEQTAILVMVTVPVNMVTWAAVVILGVQR